MLVLVNPASAARYTLKGAADAAAALVPKEETNEFQLFNLPEPRAKPEALIEQMRNARDKKQILAVCSPKIEWVLDLVRQSMASVPKEKFDGLILIVVAQRREEEKIAAVLKDRGISIRCGVFK